MNSRSLIPPNKKFSEEQKGPQIKSQVGQGLPFDISSYFGVNGKEMPKNPQQQMNIPNLSLADSNRGDPKKKKQAIHQHLRDQITEKHKPQEHVNPLSLILNFGQNIQNSEKNIVAEEEFSKKFKRMYQFPASVSEALVHQRAFRSGFNSSTTITYKNNEPIETETLLCPCCQNFVNTVQIPLSYGTYPKRQYTTSEQRKRLIDKATNGRYNSENVFLFKGGDALFFCFIKLLITFLLLRCVILDGFNLYSNYMGTYCKSHIQRGQKDLCTNWYISVFSTYNNATIQGQAFLEELDLLSLVVTIVSILFCFYGRVKLYQLYWFLEKGDSSEDDYTILIENIPPIPFLGNDSLIKDVNKQYRDFIKKLVSNKIKIWLNSFYSYDKKEEIEQKVDKEFFQIFLKKRQNQSELFQNIVTNVSLCYDLTELQNLENIREDLVHHFLQDQGDKQAMENSLFDDQFTGENAHARQYIAHLPHQIQIINQHYVQLCQRISDTITIDSLASEPRKTHNQQSKQQNQNSSVKQLKISRFVGKAFVSFQYQHYKHYLLQKFAEDRDYLKVNGNTVRLTLSHAQKPNDVYWKNMKVSDQYRKLQIRNSYILVLVGLLVSTTIMYILRSIQSSIVNGNKQQRTNFQNIILYSIPLWTFLVNYFLDWGIFQLTKTEKHKTQTEELSSLIVKNTTAKFINTSVIYALIFIFGQKVNPMKENGLVNTIFDLVYINALLNIALQFLQPGWILNNRKNKKYLQKQQVNVFQIKLNKMLQLPTFDFAQSYSYYLQMIYICSFYGFLIPAITPILIIAFAVQYWVDKFNLLKRCSSPIDMGFFLTKLTWISFQMSLVLFALGHLIWGRYFYSSQKVASIIFNYTNLGLAVGYVTIVMIFPAAVERLTSKFASQSGLSDQSYSLAYAKFQKTYRAQNPATSFLNQKEDEVNTNLNTINIVETVLANQLNIKQKHKLKSQLFIPAANSPHNTQKVRQIYQAPEENTIKCQEEHDQNFQGFSTVLCCL